MSPFEHYRAVPSHAPSAYQTVTPDSQHIRFDNLENEIVLSTATADFGGTATFNDPRRYGLRTGLHF